MKPFYRCLRVSGPVALLALFDRVRQRLTGMLCVVSAFVVLASCGGDPPFTPTLTPSVTATSITINSTSAFLVQGLTETFTATVTMSDGTTQAVTGGTWGSDATGVATVGATTGLVTSMNAGEVTIFVDAQGIRGTKRITVVPNYQGLWNGRYVVTSCTQTGNFVQENRCRMFTVGSDLPVAFDLDQTGATVSGVTTLGTSESDWFTTVAVAGGGLVFQAAYEGIYTRIAQAWQVNVVGGRLTGTVVATWTDDTPGQMVIGGTLLTVTKSSAQTQSLRLERPRGSLADVAEAIRGR